MDFESFRMMVYDTWRMDLYEPTLWEDRGVAFKKYSYTLSAIDNVLVFVRHHTLPDSPIEGYIRALDMYTDFLGPLPNSNSNAYLPLYILKHTIMDILDVLRIMK